MKLDPEKSLFHQPIFLVTNVVFLLFSIFLIFLIQCEGNYSANWNPEGFKYFLSEFSFPIRILAILIPINLIIATIHRSLQTTIQISILTQQNRFANYYKHYEMFQSHFSELSKEFEILNEKKDSKIYRRLFPSSKSGSFQVDKKFLKTINDLSKDYLDLLEKLNRNEQISYLEFNMISSNIILSLNTSWGGYWLSPMDFGNTIHSKIDDIDENEVEAATYGNITAKFITADREEVIFEKVLKYFRVLARLVEFELDLETSEQTKYLNELINKEIVFYQAHGDDRIASRSIIIVTADQKNKL